MPYTHFTKDERIALQVMITMRLAACSIVVMLGKHISSVERELFRNSEPGFYTVGLKVASYHETLASCSPVLEDTGRYLFLMLLDPTHL